MIILGVSAGFSHDAAACILIDGKVVFAIEEERIIREKYAEHKKPINAIKQCLDYCDISLNDIDLVAISWDPYCFPNDSLKPNDDHFYSALFPVSVFGVYKKPTIHIVPHHLAHAAHVFWNSPVERATIVVLDGTGEKTSGSIFIGDKTKGIDELCSISTEASLGYFYQAASSYVGLGYQGSGKLMGLAAYGNYSAKDEILPCFSLNNECGYALTLTQNKIFHENMRIWYQYFSTYGVTPNFFSNRPIFTSEYIQFASIVQNTLNHLVKNIVEVAVNKTKCSNVCLSGGVSMNAAANLVIKESAMVERLCTYAGGGDAGTSIGAAMQAYFELQKTAPEKLEDAYLGSLISNEEIYKTIKAYNLSAVEVDTPAIEVNRHLLDGKAVAVVQGREEFGARALGNRSILFTAQLRDGQSSLNTIKKREHWRPFAPAILESVKNDYLVNATDERYMTVNHRLTMRGAQMLPAAAHIDMTCRPQIVQTGSFAADVLNAYYANTSVGAVLNTSFNTGGFPIVHTIDDALREFYSSGIDCLVIGGFSLTKK